MKVQLVILSRGILDYINQLAQFGRVIILDYLLFPGFWQ